MRYQAGSGSCSDNAAWLASCSLSHTASPTACTSTRQALGMHDRVCCRRAAHARAAGRLCISNEVRTSQAHKHKRAGRTCGAAVASGAAIASLTLVRLLLGVSAGAGDHAWTILTASEVRRARPASISATTNLPPRSLAPAARSGCPSGCHPGFRSRLCLQHAQLGQLGNTHAWVSLAALCTPASQADAHAQTDLSVAGEQEEQQQSRACSLSWLADRSARG